MKVGVTGTREGATETQLRQVYELLATIPLPAELHHGDCTGVDIQVAIMAKELGFHVVYHPPVSNEQRAFHASDEFRKPAGYLQRDRAIVDETEMLIVVPLQTQWQPRGGTWYTHDWAVKTNKPVVVFPGEKDV